MGPVARDSLTSIVYNNLRHALMEGRFWPGHRFKIRELAASMQVSETPIREALMQLVRARALELLAGRSIIVAHMTLTQYLELRNIRLFLEGLAAENATTGSRTRHRPAGSSMTNWSRPSARGAGPMPCAPTGAFTTALRGG